MASTRPSFTRGDLRELPDDGRRYEVLEGDLVVSPAPRTKHQRVVRNLLVTILADAEDAGFGQGYPAPVDVCLSEDNVVEPDALFVTTARLHIVADEEVRGAPDLVAEVLSPRSRDRDFGVRRRVYRRFGVRHYWVLDPDTDTVHAFAFRPDGGGGEDAAVLRGADLLTCPLFPGVSVKVSRLFA